MWTPFAKVLNYISSFLLLYPMLICRIVFRPDDTGIGLWEASIKPNMSLIITLFVLFIVSIIWFSSFFRWKNNERIKGTATKNKTFEMAVFFASYVIPMFSISADIAGLVVTVIYFFIIGIAFVMSEDHFLNPSFLLLRYRLYKIGDKNVLARTTIDGLNILFAENTNGISVRELVRNTYIILPE